MIVNINNSTYEMNSKQYKGVLKTASKAVDRGIYAVEKNKVAIMLNERYGDDMSLRKNVDQYVKKDLKCIGKTTKNVIAIFLNKKNMPEVGKCVAPMRRIG